MTPVQPVHVLDSTHEPHHCLVVRRQRLQVVELIYELVQDDATFTEPEQYQIGLVQI